MADRGIFGVVEKPAHFGFAQPILKAVRKSLPFGPQLKAVGFGQAIACLEPREEACAFAMYAGEFCFSDECIVTAAPLLFVETMGSDHWQASLYNLSWLRHFTISKRKLHVHFALRLVGRWAKTSKSRQSLVILSRAIIALCTHGQILARSADAQSQAEFFSLISKMSSRLNRLNARSAQEAFLQALAGLYLCTAFYGFEKLLQTASEALNAAIKELATADGGMLTRDPLDMIDAMMLLSPLQDAMKLNRHVFPAAAKDALQRMHPMLAMMTQEDGELSSVFSTDQQCHRIASLKAFDSHAVPPTLASQAGYARLVGEKSNLFIDTQKDHAFEFSIGEQRLFTSVCESPIHKTLTHLHDSQHGVALQVIQSESNERIYFLNKDGTDFRVEDRFDRAIEITFNLAPQVKIAARREGGVMLIEPDKSIWNLSLRGGEVHVEKNGTVLKITSVAIGKMNWAFKRQAKLSKSPQRKKPAEPDLLS